MKKEDLIHSWQPKSSLSIPRSPITKGKKIEFFDETLRDGLQATYLKYPSLKEKLKLLVEMEKLGIESVNLGIPVSSPQMMREMITMAKFVKKADFKIKLVGWARSLVADVEAVARVSQEAGQPMLVHILGGGSEFKNYLDNRKLQEFGKLIKSSIRTALANNLTVDFMTEDTTRAHPKSIEYLFKTGIDAGAKYICISDTTGVATLLSAYNLVKFIKTKVVGSSNVIIDWHGHNDRGLAVANALFAICAGARRIHATALGVGERAGNTCMEEIILNLVLEGVIQRDISNLINYAQTASKILNYEIISNQPLSGANVFTTATGMHAATIKKLLLKGETDFAELAYAPFTPKLIGRQTEIIASPMSGRANIEVIALKHKINVTEERINEILATIKRKNRTFSEAEVLKLLQK